jgi:Zn-dependent peptidase ImmA (M78 family)/transcriptional regulator with XRE-family HTH domain
MTLTQETLGARLREARTNAQLSQDEAAAAVGLDRTALLKIEKGTRAVSGTELLRLAQLYHRDVADLLSEQPLDDDPFTVLGRIAGNATPEWNVEVNHSIELLKEAVRMEEFLGDRVRPFPPIYQFAKPLTWEDAIEQGKDMAQLERRRLDLGSAPITDVAEVIASQGIWTCAMPFPEGTAGLFVAHTTYGLAVFVNQSQARTRRRFSYAHEYAHAIVDRDRATEPTTKENAKTLIEKRANAFASEFLIPASGVVDALERMRKGGTSRASSWIWDAASDEPIHLESRQDASAQKISVHDVARLASEFKVSYEAAAIRLKDIDAIRKSHLDELLLRKDEGRSVMRLLFDLQDSDASAGQPYLVRQLVLLAMEAFRREKISTGRFRQVCHLAGYPADELLWIARVETKDIS